ncbi:AIR synthase [Candidatus Micrarchaeota archaeon]|nr:MAG: AIR synthase [Candidatus Micrarchaeota archaeon]
MLPKMGKISPEVFRRVIKPQLGAKAPGVVVPPQHGVDCGVIEIGGKYVVVESDPFYIAKELGFELASWFAVHILASDVASMGAKPTYLCVDLNLPLQISDEELEELWKYTHKACEELGVNIVAGHTARYPDCNYPMVGGATMLGICTKYVTPKNAKPGDALILTKGAAIEAAGLLSMFFKEEVEKRLGSEMTKRANALCYKMSVVEEALTAFETGGVNAMHDATECGVYGALWEMAEASGVGMQVERGKIIVKPEVDAICDMFQIDPYISISEGTLLISCGRERVDEILKAIEGKGIEAGVIGEVVKGSGVELDGKPLAHPKEDPFWNACSGKTMKPG